ncbi:MAG: hypothetical protein HY675_28955 [Chloroflexi bacterium]|nr:hypothetical protein [Chloroflexota bacterium]
MKLDLQPEEADLLKRILVNYVSDLRMEISQTDSFDLRQELKRDEVIIKAIIERLA